MPEPACSCSYEESEEATSHSLLCAVTQAAARVPTLEAEAQPEKQAARLAYFLANMGLIDTPGGAEWFGRKWSQSELLHAWIEAGTEAKNKNTAFLWDYEPYA